MDNQEAKFILRAYRPNGADAEDPTFREALTQAKADPSLSHWFDRERALDRVVSNRLQSTPVPAGLRESILAGGRVSRARSYGWRQASWFALAASVAILISAMVLWPRGARTGGASLALFAVDDLRQGHLGKDSAGPEIEGIQAALANPTNHLAKGVSLDPARLQGQTCRTLSFAGHTVFEICFVRDSHQYHLYFMRRSDAPRIVDEPEYAESSGISAATWADAHFVYAVAGTNGIAAIRRLL